MKSIPTAKNWFWRTAPKIVKKTVFSNDAKSNRKRKAKPKRAVRFLASSNWKPRWKVLKPYG
jgi:hypothetical protein